MSYVIMSYLIAVVCMVESCTCTYIVCTRINVLVDVCITVIHSKKVIVTLDCLRLSADKYSEAIRRTYVLRPNYDLYMYLVSCMIRRSRRVLQSTHM